MNHRILGLTVRNFRTLTDTKLPLGPLTVMVGPNAAGKSNVLHALEFLGDVTRNGIELALRSAEGSTPWRSGAAGIRCRRSPSVSRASGPTSRRRRHRTATN
ncbi:hypothetical protein GCM10023238_11610 [Streptomyces heliomycini]